MSVRKFLSKIKRFFKKHLINFYNRRDIKIINELSVFAPNSGGAYPDRAKIAIQSAQETFSFLDLLLCSLHENKYEFIDSAEDFCTRVMKTNVSETNSLKNSFNKYGSDKSTTHDYHLIYGPILNNKKNISAIFEIGIGTNYTDTVSNMGRSGKPGASLRAFRDYLPKANVYGADIDERILFSENRIKTFFVDQKNLESLKSIEVKVKENFDLIIDDGLHAPHANIASLIFALKKVKPGGWIVIEDIPERSLSVWKVVANALPGGFSKYIISTNKAFVFAIKK